MNITPRTPPGIPRTYSTASTASPPSSPPSLSGYVLPPNFRQSPFTHIPGENGTPRTIILTETKKNNRWHVPGANGTPRTEIIKRKRSSEPSPQIERNLFGNGNKRQTKMSDYYQLRGGKRMRTRKLTKRRRKTQRH